MWLEPSEHSKQLLNLSRVFGLTNKKQQISKYEKQNR
jgi:hypothetical protein